MGAARGDVASVPCRVGLYRYLLVASRGAVPGGARRAPGGADDDVMTYHDRSMTGHDRSADRGEPTSRRLSLHAGCRGAPRYRYRVAAVPASRPLVLAGVYIYIDICGSVDVHRCVACVCGVWSVGRVRHGS